MDPFVDKPLAGVTVVITRPVGHGRALAHRVRVLGGVPVALPGLSLRPVVEIDMVRAELKEALTGSFILFSSPAAVQFAARLAPLRGSAIFAAVGRGTARALRRQGVADPLVPSTTQDAAGLLAHPGLADVRGARVAVVGAAGGSGVLQRGLRTRGAQTRDVHVYQRLPARLTARHRRMVLELPADFRVLLSSRAALRSLQAQLGEVWPRLIQGMAVVSSLRMQQAARQAGFTAVRVAHSAVSEDMLSRAASAA